MESLENKINTIKSDENKKFIAILNNEVDNIDVINQMLKSLPYGWKNNDVINDGKIVKNVTTTIQNIGSIELVYISRDLYIQL